MYFNSYLYNFGLQVTALAGITANHLQRMTKIMTTMYSAMATLTVPLRSTEPGGTPAVIAQISTDILGILLMVKASTGVLSPVSILLYLK